MPIGIVSDDDFEEELKRNGTRPIDRKVPEQKGDFKIVDINRGRGIGNVEVPPELRNVISQSAISGDGNNSSIAAAFGISPASVSAYKNGSTSTASYNTPDASLVKNNTTIKNKIASRAHSKILAAMKGITLDKIENAKLTDLSSLAKDMSTVAKNMEPNANESLHMNNTGPTYMFFAPRIRKSDEYEIVYAKEE